jgi:SAM-dependent methyltransferase
MDLETFQSLLTPAGQTALAAAATFEPTEATFLPCFEKLRKAVPPDLARAALETAILRGKARVKFPHADRMYFTREALEQSSGDVISRYRAGRFREFGTVADLCCGIGGDTLGLASRGLPVGQAFSVSVNSDRLEACPTEAVEREPLLAAMAEANALACGVAHRVRVHIGDVLSIPLPDVQAAFADPGRRSGGRRFLALKDYLPPPAAIRDRFPPGFPLAFKLAPGMARDELEAWDAEAEFISVYGELKECVLWCGPLKTTTRRATLLPGGHTLASNEVEDVLPQPPSQPRGFVFDPDAAVIRAGLEHVQAEQLDLAPIDDGVAFFTGESATESPFGNWYRVEHANRFHAGRLRDYLRSQNVGRVTILKRASNLDADDVQRKWKLDGAEHRHVILTRSEGQNWAIVAVPCL